MKKLHDWSEDDNAIEECQPLFDHYKTQGASYNDLNAWDAVAGRMLPEVCVTGAACKRQFARIKEREVEEKSDAWKDTIEKVNAYLRRPSTVSLSSSGLSTHALTRLQD